MLKQDIQRDLDTLLQNPGNWDVMKAIAVKHGYYDGHPCAMCNGETEARMETEPFTYGSGVHAACLSADVVVYRCKKCQFELTNADAEDQREKAVRQHVKEGKG